MGKGGSVTGQGVPIANLVALLSRQLDRTVVDKTGLIGDYDFTLQWTPDESPRNPDGTPSPATLDSIVTAVQEQLGLKLEPQKARPLLFGLSQNGKFHSWKTLPLVPSTFVTYMIKCQRR